MGTPVHDDCDPQQLSVHQIAAQVARESAQQNKRGFLGRLWESWIKPVGAAVLVVVTFRSAVADWNDVPSQSMEPTILVGDRIFVNKLAYDLKVPFTTWHIAEWDGPQPGDVIVFFSPADGKRMVKRVVGVPGDTVALRDNHLHINGKPVEYGPVDEQVVAFEKLTDTGPHVLASEQLGTVAHVMMMQPLRGFTKRNYGPVVVPEGHYFVMGDNRDNSGDSRVFGMVPRERITGKAVGLAFSLDQSNRYAPRWERFFRGLD